jgi:hypothetical protein
MLCVPARADFLLWWFVWENTYLTKYNTTLVPCGLFLNSSAAPRKIGFSRAAFSQLYFWVAMLRGRILPGKFENSRTGQTLPSFQPSKTAPNHNRYFTKNQRNRSLIYGRWNAMGVQFTLPPFCNPKTRDHKQASIFVELAGNAFSCPTMQADTKFSTKFSM